MANTRKSTPPESRVQPRWTARHDETLDVTCRRRVADHAGMRHRLDCGLGPPEAAAI